MKVFRLIKLFTLFGFTKFTQGKKSTFYLIIAKSYLAYISNCFIVNKHASNNVFLIFFYSSDALEKACENKEHHPCGENLAQIPNLNLTEPKRSYCSKTT